MRNSPKDRLIRATAWHAAGRIAAGVLGIANMAYAFAALGPERYGLLNIVSVLALALSLVEFGLKTAVVQLTSADAARGDVLAVRGVLGTATLVHLVAGTVVCLPFAVASGPLVDWFSVEEALRSEASLLLLAMAVATVAGNIAFSWTGVLVALQRTGAVAMGMACGGAAQLAGTILAVRAGWGAPSLAVGLAAGTLVRSAIESVAAARALPGCSLSPVHATRASLARAAALGRPLQVVRIADVVVFQVDQILVSRFLGLGVGGVYRLANELVVKLRDVPLLLTGGVIPAATEVRDADGGQALRNLYLRGTKYVVAAAALGVAFLVGAAPQVAFVAGGAEAAAAAPVLAVLALGYLANVSVGVGCQVGLVLGHARLQAWSAVLSMAASLTLVPAALLLGLGPVGAALGTTIALVAGPAWYAVRLHAALALPHGRTLWSAYGRALPAAVVLGAGAALVHAALPPDLASGRAGVLGLLAVEGAVAGALYGVFLLRSGWLDAVDLDVARRVPVIGRLAGRGER